MMDVREKLVEIVCDAMQINECIHSCNHPPCAMVRGIVDALIENGVTVQEWISVDDRLPQENGRYLTANKRWDDKINVFDLWFDGGFWYVDRDDVVFDFEVTHWMPMPNPPKGE